MAGCSAICLGILEPWNPTVASGDDSANSGSRYRLLSSTFARLLVRINDSGFSQNGVEIDRPSNAENFRWKQAFIVLIPHCAKNLLVN